MTIKKQFSLQNIWIKWTRCFRDLLLLVTSLKMLQYDWLLKYKDIVIMTLQGAKTIFPDTWYATIEKT